MTAVKIEDPRRNDSAAELDAYWMPFTANRQFKSAPRLIASAKGHYYRSVDGRTIFDSFSGLWTSGLGHCHEGVAAAIKHQADTLDYAPAFQIGHPGAFTLAARLTQMAPEGFTQAFFTNSGSEAVETAMKIALAYHRAKGEGGRTRFIGRERGYHGVNFGGMSVGGIPANRKLFHGALLAQVSHLPAPIGLKANLFSRGQPGTGVEFADELERIIALHDASNIAAVIVEPVQGSAGVFVPPKGYLERLAALCRKHNILLIFDEVITGFGRVGAPFASIRFGVTPDLIVTAKGITNGAIPMGAVLVKSEIHERLMQGPEHLIEFFHGYTYSGHPMAAAAALAALDAYEAEDSFAQAKSLEARFESAIHSLSAKPHVVDIRNFGLMGAIELAPRPGEPGKRGLEAHIRCFDDGLLVRHSMDTLQFAPFLNSSPNEFDETFAKVGAILDKIA